MANRRGTNRKKYLAERWARLAGHYSQQRLEKKGAADLPVAVLEARRARTANARAAKQAKREQEHSNRLERARLAVQLSNADATALYRAERDRAQRQGKPVLQPRNVA